MNGIEYRLGQIDQKLANIEQRLSDGSKRHAELEEDDEKISARVQKLELIEAKRNGVMAAVAALGSLVGGLVAILINYLLKKI